MMLILNLGYGLACVIDILCNTISGIGAGFLTGGGGLLFQAYDIASFCEYEVSFKMMTFIKSYHDFMKKITLFLTYDCRNIKTG